MIKIYTDGSCLGNPGPGGWAFLVIACQKTIEFSGNEVATTNNRMEMKAIIEALKWTKKYHEGQKIVIYSDSNLLVSSLTYGWKRKKNLDLWKELDNALNNQQVTFIWVKGHANNVYNRKCDELAQREARHVSTKQAKIGKYRRQ